jgi:hypothetical protein
MYNGAHPGGQNGNPGLSAESMAASALMSCFFRLPQASWRFGVYPPNVTWRHERRHHLDRGHAQRGSCEQQLARPHAAGRGGIRQDRERARPLSLRGKAGKSRALNAGIALATHDFPLFTDDDVLTSRAWVASAVLAMARWGADGVGGRILLKWPVPPPRWLARNADAQQNLGLMDFGRPQAIAAPVRGPAAVWGGAGAYAHWRPSPAPIRPTVEFTIQTAKRDAYADISSDDLEVTRTASRRRSTRSGSGRSRVDRDRARFEQQHEEVRSSTKAAKAGSGRQNSAAFGTSPRNASAGPPARQH